MVWFSLLRSRQTDEQRRSHRESFAIDQERGVCVCVCVCLRFKGGLREGAHECVRTHKHTHIHCINTGI